MQRLLINRPARQRLRRLTRPAWLGTLRRTSPLSDQWGLDRGTPIDRYYIERFLAAERDAIHGRLLEIKDNAYTERFGIAVTHSDVLDVDSSNPQATIVSDLAAAENIADDSFDCFIFTQTLQLIRDARAALVHACRILRPGGVLLATVPGLCRVERAYANADYWRFTAPGAEALFADAFGHNNVQVRPYGNVLTATAFLSGMAAEELSARELNTHDPHYPVVIAVRATKELARA